MNDLEREKVEIPCPGGGRPIQTTYGELIRRSSLKSLKGHEYKFKSMDQQKLRRSIDNIERLQNDFERDLKKAKEEFARSFENLLSNADIHLKR